MSQKPLDIVDLIEHNMDVVMALAETIDVSEAMEILAKVDFGAAEPGERRRCLALVRDRDASLKLVVAGERDRRLKDAEAGRTDTQ